MLSTLDQPDAPASVSVRSETALERFAPEMLHPSLWLAHQLGRHGDAVLPSGFAALDAELPGGGWPRRCLSELLLRHPGIGEIRLLAPALGEAQTKRVVMLFDPPLQLNAGALASFGLGLEKLLVVSTQARLIPGSDSLWALEQALKSGHVGACPGLAASSPACRAAAPLAACGAQPRRCCVRRPGGRCCRPAECIAAAPGAPTRRRRQPADPRHQASRSAAARAVDAGPPARAFCCSETPLEQSCARAAARRRVRRPFS